MKTILGFFPEGTLLTFAAYLASSPLTPAANFADAVVSYTPGTGANLTNSQAALGNPGDLTGLTFGYPVVFSPFSPHYEGTELVQIGTGGQLTLHLSVPVQIIAGQREIGIWSNVGLGDIDFPNGTTGSTVTTFSPPDNALVEVSGDGLSWFSLNGGSPITFDLPGNYFTNAGPQDSTPPANPQFADFGKPFLGTLQSFANKTYPEILALLDGSAGGKWLDLDGVPLAEVNYLRLSNTGSAPLAINAVSVNNAVPEPASAGLALLGGLVC